MENHRGRAALPIIVETIPITKERSMSKFIRFLKGKKTYIIGGALVAAGTIIPELSEGMRTLIVGQGLLAITGRAGLNSVRDRILDAVLSEITKPKKPTDQ